MSAAETAMHRTQTNALVRWWRRRARQTPPPPADFPLEGGAPPAARQRHTSPARLFALTVASVFLGEILVMAFLSRSGSAPGPAIAIFGGLFVSFLAIPVLYFFLVRPLQDRIGELAALREQLERGREAYRSLIDSTEDSIYLVDRDGRYQFINRHHAARLEQSVETLIGRRYGDFHSPEKAGEFAAVIARVIEDGRSARHEHWSLRDERCFLRTFTPVRDRAGATVAVTVVSKDITDLKRLEKRLQELSTEDALTGLQNRRGFETLAGHRLKVAARQRADVVLLFADLDNLKKLNDAHGHQAGDRALREAAQILAETCRESDVIARIGGDEFVVLFSGPAAVNAERVVVRIQEAIRRHNAGAPSAPVVGLSIGVAACRSDESCSIEELISRADQAMYASKTRRRAADVPAGSDAPC